MVERQELYCHNCNHYVQFDMDTEISGAHVLQCPNCGHEHCRVVKNGVITEERWASNNNPSSISTSYPGYTLISNSTMTFSANSTYQSVIFPTGTTMSWNLNDFGSNNSWVTARMDGTYAFINALWASNATAYATN